MFSTKEAVKYGWNKAKEHMELAFFATLLVLVLSLLTDMGDFSDRDYGFSLLGIIATIFTIIIRIGYTKIFLKIYDGETPKFEEIFKEYKTFWRYLGTSILLFFTILGGLILLLIPGIFWAVRFSFSLLIVVDTKVGPIAAMKESYAITKGNFGKVLGFWILLGLINLLGLICLGIGLMVTIPVSTLASIFVYRKLSAIKAGLIQTPVSTSSPQTV